MSEFRAGLRRGPKSNNVQPLVFKKGDNVCNLCRQKRNLTDDHVPPQCCGNNRPIVARRIYADELLDQQVDARSGNGLKFRTLCRSCNGEVLGALDDALGQFTEECGRVLRSSIQLPQIVSIPCRPGAVLRSVLGHFVATKVQDDQVATDQRIRDYLIAGAQLDEAIKVYCWLYPFGPTVVSRDFTFVEVEGDGGKTPGIVSVIKFFPFAFCMIDSTNAEAREFNGPAIALHRFADFDVAAETTVEMQMLPIIAPGWPERPNGNHLVFGGRTYVDSVTTLAPNGATATPGKRIQAQRWEGGDSAIMQNVHAFVEIPDT